MGGCVPPDLAVRVERGDCVPAELAAHAEYLALPTAPTGTVRTIGLTIDNVQMDLALGWTKSLSRVVGLVVGAGTMGAPLAKALVAQGDPRFGGRR